MWSVAGRERNCWALEHVGRELRPALKEKGVLLSDVSQTPASNISQQEDRA